MSITDALRKIKDIAHAIFFFFWGGGLVGVGIDIMGDGELKIVQMAN